jgi:hypothetical protein
MASFPPTIASRGVILQVQRLRRPARGLAVLWRAK